MSGLSGELWPIHSKPRPDELLSSWTIRLASAHGIIPYAFCNAAWPGVPILNRDIDRKPPDEVMDVLARRTATALERVRQTTLPSLEGSLVERFDSGSKVHWVLGNGLYHRARRNPGLQFCPKCLTEDEPYLRREWRLALFSTCVEHGNVLLDRCPECEEPLAPFRGRSLTNCWKCQFDLRTAPTVAADWHAAVENRHHRAALARGWTTMNDVSFLWSHLYFELVRCVFRVLALGKRSQALREFVAARWGGDPTPPTFRTGAKEIEMLEVDDRHRLLGLTGRLLVGWPFRFVGACAEARLWAAWSLTTPAPYAYADAVQSYLSRSNPAPSMPG